MTESPFRLSYPECRDLLQDRIAEPAPTRIQLLAGPRQVGKTTLLLELAERLHGTAVYAAADAPEASLPGFWERLWVKAAEIARSRGRAVVLLDEAHLLPDWAARLKGEWDRLRRLKLPLQVVATGSSALHLGAGSRESLAGRFERVVLTHWSAASFAATFGLDPRAGVEVLIRTGTYPGAYAYRDDFARWSAYVRDAVVEPAVGRDMLALAAVRRPALLRQVFAVCALAPAQIVSLQKIRGQLEDAGALETLAHYLELLEEAFLVASLPKYTRRTARSRSAPPKLVALSNAFLAVTQPEGIPDRERAPARFGAWVENACLAHAWHAGQRVRYWREGPLEVDAIVEGSWGKWAIEVKTGAVSGGELKGLSEFTRDHPDFRALVLCDPAHGEAVARLGLPSMPWTEFLLGGPAGH